MLTAGLAAPDFTLKNQHGQPVTLSGGFRGRDVLLVFFPLAFTPICAGELGEIQSHPEVYNTADTVTLAVSVGGPPPTHKVWAKQSGFTFDLLSDFWPHGAVAEQFGGVQYGGPASPTGAPSRSTGPGSSGSPSASSPARCATRPSGGTRWPLCGFSTGLRGRVPCLRRGRVAQW